MMLLSHLETVRMATIVILVTSGRPRGCPPAAAIPSGGSRKAPSPAIAYLWGGGSSYLNARAVMRSGAWAPLARSEET